MTIAIGGRTLGEGQPVFIVAELSANHNGQLSRALATVHAAADAGADAIKLQTYTADSLTIESDLPDFRVGGGGPWADRTLYDLYTEAHTPWEWHEPLFEAGRSRGLEVFSTPFDAEAVAFLERLGAPAYKVASFELVDDALLHAIGLTGKPVIISTGMANHDEIARAVHIVRDAGSRDVVLLHCTSSYPAPDDSMNLATLPLLAQRTDCLVGLSDHSLGTTAPVAAVALGARLIEKHLTLDRAGGGVDSHFSLEPDEFAMLVRDVRRAEAMLGRPRSGPARAEASNVMFRRSLYVVEDMQQGDEFTPTNVRSIRPGFGLSPSLLDKVLGRRATRSIARGTRLEWSLVEGLTGADGEHISP